MTENSATPRRCQHLLEDSTGGRGFSKQTLIKDLAKTFGPALWRFEVVVPMTIFSLTNCHDYYHCYYFYGDCCYVYLLYSYERHPYYYYYYYDHYYYYHFYYHYHYYYYYYYNYYYYYYYYFPTKRNRNLRGRGDRLTNPKKKM